MAQFWITSEVIDSANLARSLQTPRAGALVTFEGWVRNHNEGLAVTALEYQVYEQLALKEGNRILKEAIAQFELHSAYACHRQGLLAIGDVAVWVGSSSSHRAAAFAATQYIIDNIKTRLPIWKKEHYQDAPSAWVCCQVDHSLNRSLSQQLS